MKKLGFVIVNQAEEFLSSYSIKPDYVSKSWARIPDLARRLRLSKKLTRLLLGCAQSIRFMFSALRIWGVIMPFMRLGMVPILIGLPGLFLTDF